MNGKENIIVTVSGGETSGYKAYLLKEYLSHLYNFVFVYANTGLEHEKTLTFVDNIDKKFDLNIVWLEAVVHHGLDKGSTHKIVTFETASRKGEPFKEAIKKYGLPNKHFFHCTRELKNNPITSYCNELEGFKKARRTLGIRFDEQKRIKNRLDAWYPLNSVWAVTKKDVKEFWTKQSFSLDLEEHYGNCVGCYKKSEKKLKLIADENPHYFDFFVDMENQYSYVKSKSENEPRIIYRNNRTAYEVKNNLKLPNNLLDISECAEECGSILSDYEPLSVDKMNYEKGLFD